MKPAIHYLVKAKLIRYKTADEINFIEINEKFENDNPILAREEAFKYYQNYIDVFLEKKGLEYESDKQARENLQSLINPDATGKIFDIDFSDSYGNGIGIYCVIDEEIKELKIEKGDEKLIHGIGNLNVFEYNTDFVIFDLKDELDCYRHFKYDTANKERKIIYCSRDEWQEGHRDDEPGTYSILETPFDWTGYDNPYWWGEQNGEEESEETQQNSISIEDLIEGGEGEQVEFKPTLLYNFKTKSAGIGIKAVIAKAICAFLNSKGGCLLIGVKDNGEPQGLEYDFSLAGEKNPKDFFKLEFDQMLEHFLGFSVKPIVNSDFREVNGITIFVVVVHPSKRRPVFLKGQDNPKEFWVRGNASNRQLTDPEQIINYWLDKKME